MAQKFGVEFSCDLREHNKSNNIMDRWILASIHSLLQFVKEEMAGMSPRGLGNPGRFVCPQFSIPHFARLPICFAHLSRLRPAAYRLYTVVPRLLKFIDDLTNWYVRLNRKRMRVCPCVPPHIHSCAVTRPFIDHCSLYARALVPVSVHMS